MRIANRFAPSLPLFSLHALPPAARLFFALRGPVMIQALDLWWPAWRKRERSFQHALGVRHVMIAVCDHFDPREAGGRAGALSALAQWRAAFAGLAADFRDADGVPPRHTFFYPLDQHHPELAASFGALGRDTSCETEILLHHENDTADHLRQTLQHGAEQLAAHGLLARDLLGELRYGFIHGDGALDNAHPLGRHCGVRNELSVLCATGCYADFTLPTAPDRTQTRMINSLYYARGTDHPRSHDSGRRVRAHRDPYTPDAGKLLLVQGPLTFDWHRRQFGLFPRIENGALSAANPPTRERLRNWIDCRIAIEGRPNWLFVKLHTASSRPENARMLLGEPMRQFHRAVADVAATDATLRFHYVTAREMVNILHAAESGHSGEPGRFRDYRYRRVLACPPAV